jgi:hypothetical protein
LIFNYSTGLQWSNRGRKKPWRKLKIDQPESVTETLICKVLVVLSVSTGGDELKWTNLDEYETWCLARPCF